jgi:hypothetical protein
LGKLRNSGKNRTQNGTEPTGVSFMSILSRRPGRSYRSTGILALALAFLSASGVASFGWADPPNQRRADPKINVEDKDDVSKRDGKIWVLDFKFYDPRLITVDIPARGRRLCWYMKYQVINLTKEPHVFRPDFELVTIDKPGVYHDQVLPAVEEAIKKIEDPTGFLNFQNSVTIMNKPIAPSRPEAPKAVNGLAIWDDVNPDANRFSIFVSGLSNGWSLAEIPPDNKQIVRRKTLQLNFKRLGDRYYQHSEEIHFVPPIEWVYRATNVVVGGKQPAKTTATGSKNHEATKE